MTDVSFDVYPGETVGVIGRNASGKTTLLKVLAGIIAPDRGDIRRAEINISLLSLQVGFIPHLPGRENAILSSILLGLTKQEALARLPAIIEFSELEDFIDEPISVYSAGMRARLGFSVAYYAAPEVLLIDESLAVGDQDFRVKSAAAIREIITSNHTVILVSHDLDTIRQLCDRVVWIEKGETVAVDVPEKVIPDYQHHERQRGISTSRD
ncbi:MAG: ATP-binding cassette domain-containing protein [Gammaproteobacteria bacterium]|nr:ATP-binding cassette domain-containing protein [Gammaproteobacteria bacterium]